MSFFDFLGDVAGAVTGFATGGPIGLATSVAGSALRGVAGLVAGDQAGDAARESAAVTSQYADLIREAMQEASRLAAVAETQGVTEARGTTARTFGDVTAARRGTYGDVRGQIDATKQAATGQLDQGTGTARDIYQQQQQIGSPALNYLQSLVAADASKLTPSQQIGQEDLIRSTQNNLATSGLRGAGRAGQAVLSDSIRRYVAGALDQNEARRGAAATALSQIGVGGANNQAALEARRGTQGADLELGYGRDVVGALNTLGTGTQQDILSAGTADAGFATQLGGIEAKRARDSGQAVATAYGTQGAAQSGLARDSGLYDAASTIGLGNAGASALGAIGGYFSGQQRQQELDQRMGTRPRRYANWTDPDSGSSFVYG